MMLLSLSDEIRKLQTYKNSDFPILSLYFSVPEKNEDMYDILHTQFHEMIDRHMDTAQRKDFSHDLEYIEGFLSEYKNTNENGGLAIFTGNHKLWETINVKFHLEPFLHVAYSPYLDPLFAEFEEYKRYLVILTDREKAKFFTIKAGAIEAQDEVFDPSVPQNVKANEERFYGRTDKISRHIQDHLHRHLKLISKRLDVFVKNKPISGVIVGGHSNLIHKTEEYLPERLKAQVVAEFITGLNDSLKSIMDKSLNVIDSLNQTPQISY